MVKDKFLIALRKAGFVENMPSYIRDGDFYSLAKVSTKEQAEKFLEESKKLGIKVKANKMKDASDIWFFHAYNKEK